MNYIGEDTDIVLQESMYISHLRISNMVEELQSALMETVVKIMRVSIFTFLKHIQYFSTTPVLLMLPFSAIVLLSQPLFTSYQIPIWLLHNQSQRYSASSSRFTLFLNQNFSQSFFSSILIIPFTFSFLLMAKASIIQTLNHHKPPPFSSSLTLYKPLLKTHLYNTALIILFSITGIFLLFLITFCSFPTLGFFQTIPQTVGRLLFYAFLTHIIIQSNFSLVVAGMGNCHGYKAVHKANRLLRNGRNSMALVFALFTNLGLASVEALFSFRLVRAYSDRDRTSLSMAFEGLLIAYIYSLILVVDTITYCIFLKSCEFDLLTEHSNGFCDQISRV